jgi:hypothetical protein
MANQKCSLTKVDWIQVVLILVAGVCIVAAIMRAYGWEQVDEKTAMFLALAIVALIARQITKFEGFGIKFEAVQKMVEEEGQRVRAEIKEDVQQVERQVKVIETTGLLPGRSEQKRKRIMLGVKRTAGAAAGNAWQSDPNKGQFGGAAEANGRRLKAEITPAAGSNSAACKVRFWVESTDPVGNPLTSDVTFHLHPTFGQWANFSLTPENGVAEDTITSWGAFTLAAEADDGKTKLELDLAAKELGGTDSFRAQ